MLFIDHSSAFNTIISSRLIMKLLPVRLDPGLPDRRTSGQRRPQGGESAASYSSSSGMESRIITNFYRFHQLPAIQDLYRHRRRRKTQRILSDPSHPGHSPSTLLPSGRRDDYFMKAPVQMNNMKTVLVAVMIIKLIYSGHASSPHPWNYSPGVSTRRTVEAGEEVILHCNEKHHFKTEWFGNRPGQTPFLKVSMKSEKEKPAFTWGHKLGINVTWNSNNQSFNLNITNMTPFTEGFYYCTSGEGTSTVAGTVHSLVIKKTEQAEQTTASPLICSTSPPSAQHHVTSYWILAAVLGSSFIVVAALNCWLCCNDNSHHHALSNQRKPGHVSQKSCIYRTHDSDFTVEERSRH
ncbi:uncharacterized protein LOC114800977 [Denticeps clupeoides]|uniref:uncharacterized protein LOC114800977 n=1 Tax=Denticeps clupeoides TaxID=299321 RepID=UPI0010A30B7E|nr:uncharacterized protein LOC114800977 [Denticeps clupeoides]